MRGRYAKLALALISVACSGALPAQTVAPRNDPAALVDRFLQTLQRGQHHRLGPLLTDRVANGEGRSLTRSQMVLLYQGYTHLMFGPMRSFDCTALGTNTVTCMLHFQSRRLRERYTVEPSGLISVIEVLPANAEASGQ